MAETSATGVAPWRAGVFAVLAVIALGVSLRLLFGSASAVISEIRRGYDLSAVEVAFLTTGPVVCLGLGASLAPRLARRFSALSVAAGCMAVLAVGSALRAVPDWPVLLVGTMIGGLGIAVANVLGPVLIRLLFPGHIGLMTGLLTALICVSAGVASGLTPPLTRAFGESWRLALAVWTVPALVAAVAIAVLAGSRRRGVAREAAGSGLPPTPPAPLSSRPGTARMRWAITGFMGIQSLLAYATVGWLPTIYRDRGIGADEAGLIFAVVGVASIVTAVGVPVMATRMRSQRLLSVGVVALSTLGFAGVLCTGTWGAWGSAVILGLGQGGALSLALVLMNLRSASAADATALSAMAQTIGYLLAATGPVTMGVLHSVTDGWSVPLLVLIAVTVPLAVCGVIAGHPGPEGVHRRTDDGSRAARPPIHS